MVHPGQVGKAGVVDQGAGVVQRCAKGPEAPSSLNPMMYNLAKLTESKYCIVYGIFARHLQLQDGNNLIGLCQQKYTIIQAQILACPSFGLGHK